MAPVTGIVINPGANGILNAGGLLGLNLGDRVGEVISVGGVQIGGSAPVTFEPAGYLGQATVASLGIPLVGSLTDQTGAVYQDANGTYYFVPDGGGTLLGQLTGALELGLIPRITSLEVPTRIVYDTPGDNSITPVAPPAVTDSSSGAELIYGGTAASPLTNTGNDFINAGGGNDVVLSGDGNDTVFGGSGADIISGGIGDDSLYGDDNGANAANSGNDTITGEAGNDNIYGGLGNDSLDGGDDNDSIFGGDGNDTLLGGAGQDTLFGGAGLDSIDGGDGNDILDGGDGNDTLFGGLGNDTLRGGAGSDTLDGGAGFDVADYGDQTAPVRVDLSGTTPIAQIGGVASGDTLISIEGAIGGSGSDTLVGSGTENALFGGGDTDYIFGGAGADTLDGGAGGDSISGGADNDTITDLDGDNRIQGDGGNDTITTGAGADTIYGGDGLDSINSGAGVDVVYGGAGNDSIDAGGDNDSVYGGSGDDTVAGGAGNDLIRGDTDGGATGAAGSFVWTGSTGNPTAGYSQLNAATGITTTARVTAGQANGNLESVNDTAQYLQGSNSAGRLELTDNGATSTMTLEVGFSGSVGNVSFRINDLDRGTQTGSTFADTVQVFAYGPDGQRTLVNLTPGTATDIALSNGTTATAVGGGFNQNQAGGSLLVSIPGPVTRFEIVYGANSPGTNSPIVDVSNINFNVIAPATEGNDVLSGGAGLDTIYGDGGNDSISGGADADTLYGGAGNDTVNGDDGNDSILGDAGNDSLYGGTGDDTILGGTGTDRIEGGDGADSLVGDDGDDAAGSNDTILGGAGNDTISGNGGADDLQGGTGNDLIYGGSGADQIQGNEGNDSIYGGAGNDVMLGQAGADTFFLEGGHGADTINGGEDTLEGPLAIDTINTTAINAPISVVYTSGEAGNLSSTAGTASFENIEAFVTGNGADTIDARANGLGGSYTTGGGADTIIGGEGSDTMSGEGGNDRFVLTGTVLGSDVIFGGAGTDTLSAGGVDTIPGVGSGVNLTVRLDAGAARDGLVTASGTGTGSAVISGIEQIETGAGNDTINGANATTGYVILTGAGNDQITLGSGADSVLAGSGDDTLEGGAGNDTLFGEAGSDTFIVSGPGLGRDLIDGGSTGTNVDTLDSSAAVSPSRVIFSGSKAGTLQFGGQAAAISADFSDIEVIRTGEGGDIVDASLNDAGGTYYTNGGADSILGGTGADIIYGGAGADSINGGAGNDNLFGGFGSDTFFLSNGYGVDTIDGGEDTPSVGIVDTINTTGVTDNVLVNFSGFEAGTVTTPAVPTNSAGFINIEAIVTGAGNDTINGANNARGGNYTTNAGADVVIGGTGNDTISTGADADIIRFVNATMGNDQIDGGAGFDTLDAASVGPGVNVTVDYSDGAISGGTIAFGGTGSGLGGFSNIEAVRTGAGNDLIDGTGHGLAINAATNAGNDTLLGGTAADSLDGGDGNDSFNGGLGADTLIGGQGNDTFGLGNTFGADSIVGGENAGDADLIDASTNTENLTVNYTAGETGNVTSSNSNAFFTQIEAITTGSGNDVITAQNNDANSTYTTGAGNDSVIGGSGSELIYGGDGNDTLDGGLGNDSLYGGLGSDTFKLSVGYGSDFIDGGEDAPVSLQVDRIDTTNITTGVVVSFSGFETGTVTTPGVPTNVASFINIEGITTGQGADLIDGALNGRGGNYIAGAGADTIIGGTGNDTIFGGGGADVIRFANSDMGNDSIDGGAGVDTLDSSTAAGTVNVLIDLDSGASRSGSIAFSGTGTGQARFDNIEAFTTGAGNDTIDGSGNTLAINVATNGGNDSIIGTSGNDTVNAGSGDDVIEGGAGNDSLLGDAGSDRFVLGNGYGNDTIVGGESAGDADLLDASTNTGDMLVDYSGSEAGTIASSTGGNSGFTQIEAVTTGSGNDTIDASDNTANSTYTSGAGNDSILGGAGAETAFGGEGNDTLNGGAGNDTLYGGNGNNSFLFTGANFGIDSIVGGTVGIDTLNTSGATNAANILFTTPEGGTMTAGTGNGATFEEIEAVVTGAGNDTINAAAAGPISIVAGAGADIITGGAFADTITAGSGNDVIDAGAGNDIVNGDEGNDTINGGAGADTLNGGDGDDTFNLVGEFGNDSITGGEGGETAGVGDLVDLSTQTADVTVNFDTTNQGGTINAGDNTASFAEIERIVTGSGNDQIFGNAGSTSPINVSTGAGNDTLFGGAGNDTLDGGDGDDALNGGLGADVLNGGAGNDALTVGAGDTADGGEGNDVFSYDPTAGTAPDQPNAPITIVGGGGIDTFNLASLGTFEYRNVVPVVVGGLTSYSGQIVINPGTAQQQIINFSEMEIPCFTAGTMIETPEGLRDIDTLEVGDMVVTRDSGAQAIRWIGRRTVPAKGHLAPIRIRAGAVPNLARDLLVSPQHRMLIEGYRAQLLFGQDEVLASAKHMIDDRFVTREEGGDVTYIHIIFDKHEIIYAEGAATESFHPGTFGIDALENECREELFNIFPMMRDVPASYGETARRVLRAHEVAALAS